MRLFPRLRRENAARVEQPDRKVPAGEAGQDGDTWYGDLYGGGPDVNPELTGSAKFDEYDRMVKQDVSVRGLEMFVTLPVRAAAWGLNPRDDKDPIDVLIRDMVAWNLGLEGEDGQMDLSWDGATTQGLRALRYGAMFEELVWDFKPGRPLTTWRDADGDVHDVIPLARLAPRYPKSIRSVKRQLGRVVSLEQWTPNTRPIPGDKLSYLVYEPEGGRWDGVSIFRPAWFPWKVKSRLMVAGGIGYDRHASGTPAIWHPDTPEGEEIAKGIGEGYRANESGYVHFPVPAGTKREEAGWWMEILNGAVTLADPVPFLRWCSGQIAEAGLAHFSQLGNTETGSRAVAQTQIDPFFLAVEALADYLRRERSRQVIRKIVEVNFGREAADMRSPILTVSKIQARSVETITNAIATLKDAGIALNYPEVVEDLCELLGLPLPPEGFDTTVVEGDGLGVPGLNGNLVPAG